jgi:cyclopropane fatty-acyl-phospholipid synthase-like methyltransferase
MPQNEDGPRNFREHYISGHTPWDSGQVSDELLRVLNLGLFPGINVLELGCGTGTNAIELARRGYAVTAVDYVDLAIQKARDKAQKAGGAAAKIDFKVADITRDDLGGPYDLVFDRGVYHSVRAENLSGFLDRLKAATRAGTRWLSLAGNANEKTEYGPPRVHEHEIRAELEPLFEILQLREFRFGTAQEDFRPLGWSILMRRK